VNASRVELAIGPLRQMRRSLVGWAIGLGAVVAVTVAFWPAFRGSSGISEAIDQLPAGVIQAFGLAGFGTPAGFLRGNLYELIVPLLMAVAAVAAANGLTAAEEDAGRLETYLSQPVSRQSVFFGRTVGPDCGDPAGPAGKRCRPRARDRNPAGDLDGRVVRLTRAPIRDTRAGGRRMAGSTFCCLGDWDRGRCWRLSGRRAPATERSTQGVERSVALDVGARRRPPREPGRAVAICRPTAAHRRVGRARRGWLRSPRCARGLTQRNIGGSVDVEASFRPDALSLSHVRHQLRFTNRFSR